MTETRDLRNERRTPARTTRFRVGALAVLAVAAALILWLILRDTGGSSKSSSATAVSESQIADLAASVNHPVFWAGPQKGVTYELTRSSNGNIVIRYLPSGVDLGSKNPYLTVATYPFAGAYTALQAIAKNSGSTAIRLPNGGLGVVSSTYPESIHIAYPNVDYQIEVFDPTPSRAIAAARRLAAFGNLPSTSTTPSNANAPAAASAAQLKSLEGELGHPIYWIGPQQGYTYEVTRAPNGSVYIRYLPPGASVGAKQAYTSVATYPFPGALAALQALAKQKSVVAVKLPGGGLALINKQYPKSIHLAYPNSDYQVEVFDQSPARARRLVSSGRVETVG